MSNRITTRFRIAGDQQIREVEGQEARTLNALVTAGSAGITSLDISTWALRTSHYIYKLRKLGLSIDMEREPHAGPVPGKHGRYRLRTAIQILEDGEAVAA